MRIDEIPETDRLEQDQPADPRDLPTAVPKVPGDADQANLADLLEQDIPVPLDDDYDHEDGPELDLIPE